MKLGERIKKHRKILGMTQMEIAIASDITQATISRLESGEVLELRSEGLKRLAAALGVTVDYLIGKTDNLTPDDIVRSDSEAEQLLKGFENLSSDGRAELIDFLDYLESKKKREKK